MPNTFRRDIHGYVFEAVVLTRDRSPFADWFFGLEISSQQKVLAAITAVAETLSNQPFGNASGRIGPWTSDFKEIRFTKPGVPHGPHLRGAVVIDRHDKKFNLLTGFTKQSNQIESQDTTRAQNVHDEWRRRS